MASVSYTGKLDEAERLFLRALAELERILGADHAATLDQVYQLGIICSEQDKLHDAEQIFL